MELVGSVQQEDWVPSAKLCRNYSVKPQFSLSVSCQNFLSKDICVMDFSCCFSTLVKSIEALPKINFFSHSRYSMLLLVFFVAIMK